MEAIEIKNLTDDQWKSYMTLLKDIKEKFVDDYLIDDGDWNEFRDFYSLETIDWKDFKKQRFEMMKGSELNFFNEYVLINDGKIVGWTAHKIYDDKCEFLFDTIYEEIPEEAISVIFDISKNYINDRKKNSVSFPVHEKRKHSAFKKIKIEPDDEMVFTRLLKEDMNVEYWKELVKSNKNVDDLKLLFCNEIPEESYQNYVDFVNEIVIDKEYYNPKKTIPTKTTLERLKKRIESDREDTDPLYMYLLLDGNEIAAVCSVYIERSNKIVLNHNGALTAVSRKHRGKNLAKYLKAKMYLKVLEDFQNIDYVLTDTYPWNKYMYRINEELGFKPYRTLYNYKLTEEFLENYSKKYSEENYQKNVEEYKEVLVRFYDVVNDKILDKSGLNFYLDEIKNADGTVLEVGVGTGRIFIPALNNGADMYGIDQSKLMLENLKEKLDKKDNDRIWLQDVRELKLEKKFKLIISPFRVFQHLYSIGDQIKALDKIYEHLEVGGRFIFDVFVPDIEKLASERNDILEFDGEYEPGKELQRFASIKHSYPAQILDVVFKFIWNENGEKREEENKITLRYYFRYELENLIARTKFKLVNIYGDFYRNPLSDQSKDFVIICSK